MDHHPNGRRVTTDQEMEDLQESLGLAKQRACVRNDEHTRRSLTDSEDSSYNDEGDMCLA
jgi:hypothetical protein